MITGKCERCGKEFKVKRDRTRFCSAECYEAYRPRRPLVKCISCGKEFYGQIYRQSKYCSMECRNKDWHNAHANDCRLSDDKKRQTRENKERARMERRMIALLKRSIKQRTSELKKLKAQPIIHVCKECGIEFQAKSKTNVYCSRVCYKKASNRINTLQKDKRLNKNGKPDTTITLSKLYERDGGTCNKCGIVCDWQDIEVRDDGVMIAGASYPSIDHILPIASGGKHEWDNVQLLCRRCNWIKGAK